ncbi:transposable element Tc1 transposase [Trichonephila clavipes]|nr:transposable element Tc1 transposase [Trichonephila clavipes]
MYDTICKINSWLYLASDESLNLETIELKHPNLCDSGVSVDAFFHSLYRQPVMTTILGTGSSEVTERLARVVSRWNIVQISYGATSPALSDRENFPMFFRTVAPDSSHNAALLSFVLYHKWFTVATLHEQGDKHSLEDFDKRNMPGKRARKHFSQLSEFERGLIIGMESAGWSTRHVAGQVDCSECAVRNCWQQWTREGTHARKTGSGATRKTTRIEDRRIVRQALVYSTVTRSTIRADVGVTIVPQTIFRHLSEANLKSKRPFRALPLTPEHRQLRLQWCQTRSMWNVTDWQKVVFSDESRFVLGTDNNRVRVWRLPAHVWDQQIRQMPSCYYVHDLELAVQDLSVHLPQDNIRCLINSMPDRAAPMTKLNTDLEQMNVTVALTKGVSERDYKDQVQEIKGQMRIQSVEALSPHVGRMEEFEDWGANSSIVVLVIWVVVWNWRGQVMEGGSLPTPLVQLLYTPY